jgi:hypothetical protein
MDTELSQSRQTALKKKKGKGKAPTLPIVDPETPDKSELMDEDGEEDLDIEAQMEAELKAMLQHGGGDMEELDSGEEEVPMDYNLIKNFLESFKSQAGLSGPVGNLAGRLQPGWTFPRDDS